MWRKSQKYRVVSKVVFILFLADAAYSLTTSQNPLKPRPTHAQLESILDKHEDHVYFKDNTRGRLEGYDLSRIDLSGREMSRISLAGSRLSHAVLRQARLGGADLSACVLDNADLTLASLSNRIW